MDFNPNKTPIEIIKELAFGGTMKRGYFDRQGYFDRTDVLEFCRKINMVTYMFSVLFYSIWHM